MLSSALGCLFVLLFGFLIIVLSFGKYILNFIIRFLLKKVGIKTQSPFGFDTPNNRNQTGSQTKQSRNSNTASGNAHHAQPNNTNNKGKIFSKDEGQYVDYEEI